LCPVALYQYQWKIQCKIVRSLAVNLAGVGFRASTQPTGAAALIYWVKVAKSVVVTRGFSPLLPNNLVTATVT
jgi:hypothetical protein